MRLISLLLLATVAACGGGDGSDDDAGNIDADSDGCPNVWTLVAGADTSATIENGALVISGTNLAGNDLQVYRDGLVDDFEFVVAFESLDTVTEGPFIVVGARDPASGLGLAGGVHSFPYEGATVYDLPSSANGRSGFVRLETPIYASVERTGTRLRVTAGNQFDGTGIERTDLPATGPVRVWFYFGSAGGTTTLTTARISDFMVVSGTGITSDSFDCDSLIR